MKQEPKLDSDDKDKQLSLSDEEELMFAFRGAGNSFGIITRIVYQVGRSLENSFTFSGIGRKCQ